MTIEIHQPELEALIQQRLASGRFQSVEDVLMQELKSTRTSADGQTPPQETLEEMFAKVRGLADDLDFSRDRSPERPLNLS